MLKRRWPRPMFRSMKMPSSSGPRCRTTSRIASSCGRETIRPDRLENAIPLMPHIYFGIESQQEKCVNTLPRLQQRREPEDFGRLLLTITVRNPLVFLDPAPPSGNTD